MEVHDRAFRKIKEMVTAPPLLKFYEREKDLVIQCNASEGSLGMRGHLRQNPVSNSIMENLPILLRFINFFSQDNRIEIEQTE